MNLRIFSRTLLTEDPYLWSNEEMKRKRKALTLTLMTFRNLLSGKLLKLKLIPFRQRRGYTFNSNQINRDQKIHVNLFQK